jgi:hypothetical protein
MLVGINFPESYFVEKIKEAILGGIISRKMVF